MVTVILGAQIGDEGKGKITDYLAESAAAVVRFQGGNNAGHTIIIGDETFKLHLLPSGILREGTLAVIGNGVVLDPRVFSGELDALDERGLSYENLRISLNAHLIMPYHVRLDHLEEDARSAGDSIGTTRRGIGPCYADKAARLGVRVQDLLERDVLRSKVEKALAARGPLYGEALAEEGMQVENIVSEYFDLGTRLAPYITDTARLLWDLIDEGKTVLCEGAQGALLDIDHGSFPFVTSSNCIAAAACTGAGIPPQAIDEVWGVAKAYPTRIDTVGPFPTSMAGEFDDIDDLLIERGFEFGTTTGRRRRCGWLDLVALRYAARVNGMSALALTKLDVMHGIDPIRVCTAYRLDGELIDYYPQRAAEFERLTPVYEELDGFEDVSGARSFDELPGPARDYVHAVEAGTGVPVRLVGVGRERSQILTKS